MRITDTVKKIRKYMNRVYGGVFFFIAVLSVLQILFFSFVRRIGFSEITINVITSLLYAFSYFFAIFLFGRLFKKTALPARFSSKRDKHPIPIAFVALAVIISSARLGGIFGLGASGNEFEAYHGAEIIVLMFSSVIIPAFCEELFFRGMILTNLLPLGRGFAIIVSGVIFGFAHGNHDQIFFATISGIVLGWIYVETDSIWTGIAIHMANNMIALTQSVILGLLPYEKAYIICACIELSVLIFGAISLVYLLICHRREEKNIFDGGSFGRILPSFRTAETHATFSEYMKGFFSPISIAFLCYVIFNEVLYVFFI